MSNQLNSLLSKKVSSAVKSSVNPKSSNTLNISSKVSNIGQKLSTSLGLLLFNIQEFPVQDRHAHNNHAHNNTANTERTQS